MRKLQGNDDHCCGYEEKRRANRVSRNAKKNVTNNCCDGVRDVNSELDQIQSKSSTCCRVEKKSRRIKKPEKLSLDLNEVLTRIKPSYDERKKYVNVKHILCILDTEEAVRLKKVKELRKTMEENENCDETGLGEDVERRKKETGKSKADEEGGGLNRDNVKGKGARGKHEDTVKGKKSKQVLRDGKIRRETHVVEDECTDTKGVRRCNSICSIDSEVNVGEFALTKEEISSIEKNRKQPDSQKDNKDQEMHTDDVINEP